MVWLCNLLGLQRLWPASWWSVTFSGQWRWWSSPLWVFGFRRKRQSLTSRITSRFRRLRDNNNNNNNNRIHEHSLVVVVVGACMIFCRGDAKWRSTRFAGSQRQSLPSVLFFISCLRFAAPDPDGGRPSGLLQFLPDILTVEICMVIVQVGTTELEIFIYPQLRFPVQLELPFLVSLYVSGTSKRDWEFKLPLRN